MMARILPFFYIFSVAFVGFVIVFYRMCSDNEKGLSSFLPLNTSEEELEDFDNNRGTLSGEYIVPNVVHFIRFGNRTVSFIEAVCMLAALKNQKPLKLIIHSNQVDFTGGKYWDVVQNHPLAKGVVEVRYFPQPVSIFGQDLNKDWILFHAGDVARLEVLMLEGGIFLDGDSYIVRSLNDFRKYEMTLGWEEGGGISNQVILAHKHARFLTEWYNSYKDYRGTEWFYNAGEKPTQILKENPHLVHTVPRLLAEWKSVVRMIYLERSTDWLKHYALHLLIRHQYILGQNLSVSATYPVEFDEENILNYDANIREMAVAVYPFPPPPAR